MKKETLKISGMSCNHCVMRVTNALKGIEGVEDAKVSLEGGGKAEVSYDEAKLGREKLVEAVAETGYKVEG